MGGQPDESARILRGHASNVQHIQFIDNGSQLASVGTDGQLLYWDLRKRSIARECFLDLALAYRIEMSEDGSRLVAGFTNGNVGVYCPSESK
jgi:WD40 repeat protein